MYIYTRIDICKHTHIEHLGPFLFGGIYVCTYEYTYIYTHAVLAMHERQDAMYFHIYVFTHIYTYISHIYVHSHTSHMYVHTYTTLKA